MQNLFDRILLFIMPILAIAVTLLSLVCIYQYITDDTPKPTKIVPPVKTDATIDSTIRLKETGCTYLVFSDGSIVPEYGVDGEVVGCGQ
jgi:hypothetical protein